MRYLIALICGVLMGIITEAPASPLRSDMTIGTPPAVTPSHLPAAGGSLEFVSLPLRACGPGGCGVASQPATAAQGFRPLRPLRNFRPFGGMFRR
jgi:hypothetical protein